MSDLRCSFVITFNCPHGEGESIILDGVTRAEALQVRDALGCPATEARPLAEVVLRGEPWMKDGQLRCSVVRGDGLLSEELR